VLIISRRAQQSACVMLAQCVDALLMEVGSASGSVAPGVSKL
jgi:hypothetical protein